MFIFNIIRAILLMFRAMFAAESAGEFLFKLILWFIGALVPFSFLLIWPKLIDHGSGVLLKRKAERIAKKKGIAMDRYIKGENTGAIVDKNTRNIIFLTHYEQWELAFDQIRGLEWEWIDRNGRKTKNHLVFLTNDEEKPLYKVGSLDSHEAQEWHNRLEMTLQLS